MASSPSIPIFPVAETRYGKMFTLQGDTVIGRSLRLYGEFAGDEVDSILTLVQPGDHVLDIGANIGVHTLALAQKVGPDGAVTAFEPQRHCFQLLCANVTANQYPTVQCLRAAVGDKPGTCRIPLLDPTARHNAGATAVTVDTKAEVKTDTVALMTIDSLALPRCDFVKIDTEGFEDRVVQGARQMIETLRPVLYIELHDREKLQKLVGYLKPLGYSLILHHTHFFRANNPMGEGATIFAPNAGGTALVALPPGRSLPRPLPGRTQVIP